MVEECGLNPKVTFVPSHENKADELTRVPQTLLKYENSSFLALTSVDKTSLIYEVHKLNHFGVNRTLFFVQRFHPRKQVSHSDVERVFESCSKCLSIDPVPWQFVGAVVFYLLKIYGFAWLVM